MSEKMTVKLAREVNELREQCSELRTALHCVIQAAGGRVTVPKAIYENPPPHIDVESDDDAETFTFRTYQTDPNVPQPGDPKDVTDG